MRKENRRALAYIVARSLGAKGTAVYDYDSSTFTFFSGSVGASINIYDHTARTHISGTLGNLHFYGSRAAMHVRVIGQIVQGYDYDSAHNFTGSVRRNNVQIYDYETGRYHQYVLS